MLSMPNGIHWGYEDKNLTGTDLIRQDDGTNELIEGGPGLTQAGQGASQELYRGRAVEILEA